MTSCTLGSSASFGRSRFAWSTLARTSASADFGIEPSLELEQHVTAALVGGRAHFLDVADRLELGLDRPQQKTFGILRTDAALRELDVHDRDPNVRLGLLRNCDISDEAGAQQKQQRDDRQTGMADGVIDEARHDCGLCVRQRCAVGCGCKDRLDQITFANEVLALHDDARAIRHAGEPHGTLIVLDDGRGNKPDLGFRIDRADADVACGRNNERRARHAGRRHRRKRNDDLRGNAVGDGAIGIGQFDLNPIGAGGRDSRTWTT